MQNVSQQITALQDVNYLVVGLGVTGYSVASYLLSHGYRCRIQDTRDIPPFLRQLKSRYEIDFRARTLDDPELLEWADVLVLSPGLPMRQPAIESALEMGKEVIGDIELFARLVTKPVIAITGSNGKSTVTTLLGEMIAASRQSVAVGGNIGTAALDLLETDADFYVLELSSYQLETTSSLRPAVAALLNLSEDHLDRYPDYRAYIDAKLRIYNNALLCVSNFDDHLTRNDERDLCFSLDANANVEFKLQHHNGDWLAQGDELWLKVDELGISGRHNWSNCLAAATIADAIGIDKDSIIKALKSFRGIAHRSQWVAEIADVEWINDSKATNVGAAIASIEGRDRPVILIAGGQSKGADMSAMLETLRSKVKMVLLMGEDADLMQKAWQGATSIERVENMQQAVKIARQEALAGDCVLLAPACASFDMYEKFEMRGDDFMQQVKELVDV
jgi:UDP-N-acetylmuramoylalanine--D-glutamate ligase